MNLRIDLHVHSFFSADGVSSPEDLIASARAAGLHGFAITDHNTCEAVGYMTERGLMRADGQPVDGFLVVPGIEVTTADGHLLCLGCRLPSSLKGMPSADVCRLAHEAGGIAVAPHPLKIPFDRPRQPRHRVWCRGVRLVTSAAGREEHITSTDNATVKHFAKLVRNRGYREECGSIVVACSNILSEVCGGVAGVDGVGSALTLFLAEDADVPPGVTARRIVRAPEHVLKKAAGLQSVDRVDAVAELSMPPVVGVGALTEAGLITRLLALDGIQDPGNLGTLVRTALALGWDAVALLPGTCDPYNDKVRDFAPV